MPSQMALLLTRPRPRHRAGAACAVRSTPVSLVRQAGTVRGRAAIDVVSQASNAVRRNHHGDLHCPLEFYRSGSSQRQRHHKAVRRCKGTGKKFGVTAKEIFWTLGRYDVVAIFEAPDDASMTALGLALGAAGNVRTQTLRAFSREEMNGVLAKLA